MTRLLLVASGGALGAMLRYGAGLAAARLLPGATWPWATFSVNILGGLLMGLLAGWLAFRAGAHQESIRLFGAVGLLGGFTTFSAFSLETALLFERRQSLTAITYALTSVVVAVAALFVGLWIARRAFGSVA